MTPVGVAFAVAGCRRADRGRFECADSGASAASVVRHEGARRCTLLRVPRVAPSDRRYKSARCESVSCVTGGAFEGVAGIGRSGSTAGRGCWAVGFAYIPYLEGWILARRGG
jgi:hypothetical protein